jgi:hypothetical protein
LPSLAPEMVVYRLKLHATSSSSSSDMIVGNASLTLGRMGDAGSSTSSTAASVLTASSIPPRSFLPETFLSLAFWTSGDSGGLVGKDGGGVVSGVRGAEKKSESPWLGTNPLDVEGDAGGDCGWTRLPALLVGDCMGWGRVQDRQSVAVDLVSSRVHSRSAAGARSGRARRSRRGGQASLAAVGGRAGAARRSAGRRMDPAERVRAGGRAGTSVRGWDVALRRLSLCGGGRDGRGDDGSRQWAKRMRTKRRLACAIWIQTMVATHSSLG